MDSPSEKALAPTISDPREQLLHLFGNYRAEWLKGQIYELFTVPSYFPEISIARPCVLIGGRGTGKTTVFKCMTYEGKYVLEKNKASNIPSWKYFGLYYRVNTNRVTAFQGPEFTDIEWIKIFAHYFNLLILDKILYFVNWIIKECDLSNLFNSDECVLISEALNIPVCNHFDELMKNLKSSLNQFHASINNIQQIKNINLSLQGVPIDLAFEILSSKPIFKNKDFFILIDEYENFLDYQQQVVNTLIKHAGEYYTFKIGVKELGWRVKSTLNVNEQLISPADYARIDITSRLAEGNFDEFASKICNQRFRLLTWEGLTPPNLEDLFPKLSDEQEAILLDKKGKNEALIAYQSIKAIAGDSPEINSENMPLLKAYFLSFWADSRKKELSEIWKEYLIDKQTYNTRYTNYKYPLLFTLIKNKTGIRKYYSGWDVFSKLSGSNIRYYLQLVDQSLLACILSKNKLTIPISPELQTKAAQYVGKINLAELEGLSVQGAKITKMLLGLGRVFQVMASQLAGHAPEVNQFNLSDDFMKLDDSESNSHDTIVDGLIKTSVMHMALIRSTGTKPTDETDTKDYDYMIHPIFSPFFTFSYRKKRKMIINAVDLIGFINQPKETIKAVLERNNREFEDNLPEQMALFKGYYNA